MNKLFKRAVSAILGALMIAGSVPVIGASDNVVPLTLSQTAEEAGMVAEGSTESTVDPYIADFTSVANANRTKIEWRYFDGKQEGKQKTIVNKGDDNSSQLIYSPAETTSFSPYRGFLAFKEANVITMEHKYARITYKAVDNIAAEISLLNNAGAGTIVAVPNTMASNGEWVVSDVFDISQCDILKRLVNKVHVTLQYTSTNPEAEIYIKNIMFFGSPEQAYAYVGDAGNGVAEHSELTFGSSGTAALNTGANYGEYTVNDTNGSIDIVCADSTNMKSNYMAKIKFGNAGDYNSNHVFTRVLYAADNPDGVDSVGLYLVQDNNGQVSLLAKEVKDTDGKFVLSETNCVAATTPARFATGMHVSLVTDNNTPGGTYSVKAIYFFATRADADSFKVASDLNVNLTINNNPISLYNIVIDKNDPAAVEASSALALRISELTGIAVPIVGDDTAEGKYEIIIGKNSRAKSYSKFDELQAASYVENRAIVSLDGDTLVFTAAIPASTKELVNSFLLTKLYVGIANIPEKINIDSTANVDTVNTPYVLSKWGEKANAADPEKYVFSLDFDEGYFNEENAEDNFEYYNGVYRTKAGVKNALSYIHVYEQDTEFGAAVKYTEADKNADFGIMTRYNSAAAWIKAGYDFAAGEWYIDTRMGADFYTDRIASKADSIKADTWYTLTLKVDEGVAKFYVNGEKILESENATHRSPGRVGVYTEGAAIAIDNVSVTLLNGDGIIWTNVAHTKLPTDFYMEGGTVYVMNDGSFIYQHHTGTTFKSTDNGTTWVKIDTYFPRVGYPNMLRLNNGDWLQMFSEGGYWKSRTSSDDGKTWVTGGILCATKYPGSVDAGAGNMNDKLLQIASGRIFYGQNYEGKTAHEGRSVFCEFYYSDDNGKTWTKSETDSWEIVGNEKHTHFGEAKLLECADGTIRMYASWTAYGCIVYSDSNDGGKTFGPLQYMEDFPCSRSSMQFVRDVYADNDTTYYMVWVNNPSESKNSGLPRSRLTLAKSTDGKNWEILGDVWRWESEYRGINQVVDPFINVTEDMILVGSGFSEQTTVAGENGVGGHNSQRQHVYAIPKASVENGEYLYKFTDVDTSDSYYDAVKYAVDNGLFNGTSETTFAPDTVMTRAMFVTVLGRLAGVDTAKYTTTKFADVAAGQWYTAYVGWASENGIVNGMSEKEFGVNGNITVEQACTILFRYANGKTAAEKSGMSVADFTDGAAVSSWATDAVKWAVENGIYTGVGEALSPSSAAPRWLVATMFANYASLIK